MTKCKLNGSTPSRTEKSYWESGDIPWFTVNDIRNQGRIICDTEQRITRKALTETSVKLLPPNTVLLCCTASVGEYALTRIPLATNQQFNGLVIKQEYRDKVLPEFLFYMSQNFEQELYRLAGQTSFQFVSVKNVKQIKIPIPPISIQEEIVQEIEKYQKIINGARQIVDNYKPTIKINSQWDEVEVGDMYDISYGVTISIPQNEDENGIKIISTAEVGLDGQLDLSEIRKVRYENKYKKFILEPDTLLFNWRNAPKHVGKTAWFLQEDDRYISASFLLSMKNKNPDCYDNGFVWCALNNLRETGYFMRNARQAVNQSNFNGEQLANTKLRMPSIEEQKQIMATIYEEMTIVEQNKRLIQIFEKKIKDKIAEAWGE